MPTKFQSKYTAEQIEEKLDKAGSGGGEVLTDQLNIKDIKLVREEIAPFTFHLFLHITTYPFLNNRIIELIKTTDLVKFRINTPRSVSGKRRKNSISYYGAPDSLYYPRNDEENQLHYEKMLETEINNLFNFIFITVTENDLRQDKNGNYYIFKRIDFTERYENIFLNYDSTAVFSQKDINTYVTKWKAPLSYKVIHDNAELGIPYGIDIGSWRQKLNYWLHFNHKVSERHYHQEWYLESYNPIYGMLYESDTKICGITELIRDGTFPINWDTFTIDHSEDNMNLLHTVKEYDSETDEFKAYRNIRSNGRRKYRSTNYMRERLMFNFAILKETYQTDNVHMWDKVYHKSNFLYSARFGLYISKEKPSQYEFIIDSKIRKIEK